MASAHKPLSDQEARQCLQFLNVLGIDHPDHPIFQRRGYFGLYLNGLEVEELPAEASADRRKCQETIRLLVRAGVPELQDLLVRQTKGLPLEPLPHRPVQRDITVQKPTLQEKEHFRGLPHPEKAAEAVRLATDFLPRREFLDAYHILAEYLAHHDIERDVLGMALLVIEKAGQWDRAAAIAPENMLHECEELAIILSRKLPLLERDHFGSLEDYEFAIGCARLTYRGWCRHARNLLLHRFHATNTELMTRNWIDPQNFGFLVEIMRAAVRSRLPLNMLRFVYDHLRECIQVGKNVIAHENKRARFEGDLLRILASPTRDVIPDMCFEMYRDIVAAYIEEGDTQSALLFTKQALLIRNNDREMIKLRDDLLAAGHRSPSHKR